MELIPATTAEREDVLRLLVDSGLPPDGWAEHLGTTIVARDGARVVGSAALEVHGEAALLRSVAVVPEWRGSGLGQRLTAGALDLARARRLRAVYLLTTTAEKFFPRFGFVQIERNDVPDAVQRSVEFTSACPSTAIVMRLVL